MEPSPLPPPLPPANPYAAPVARLEDAATTELELADRGIRLVATIVDNVILAVPSMVLGFTAAAAIGRSGGNLDGTFVAIAVVAALATLAMIVVNLVLLHRNGQTIAKKLFGIKVLRTDGARCGLARIVFMRWLPVALLEMIPLVAYVVYLLDALMIFGREQRCLHDYIADTIVVKA